MSSFQDRYYDRDSQPRHTPLQWVASGSVPLFSMAGIRVRVHVSLALFVALELLVYGGRELDLAILLTSLGILLVSLLMHELGHCLAARVAGGSASDVLLWPVGGLVAAVPPQRPLATFVTVLAGPATNLLLCFMCASGWYMTMHAPPPLKPLTQFINPQLNWHSLSFYLWYGYMVNLSLLLLNLLPISPLDGGQLLQTVLWRVVGYGRSLLWSLKIGTVGAAALGVGSLMAGAYWLIFFVAVCCLLFCIQQYMMVKAAGVWSFEEYDYEVRVRRHRLSRYKKWRARRQIHREELEQGRIDVILQKVYEKGIRSLKWAERRALRRATERQRQREMEETSR